MPLYPPSGGKVTLPTVTNLIAGDGAGGATDSGVAAAALAPLASPAFTGTVTIADATPVNWSDVGFMRLGTSFLGLTDAGAGFGNFGVGELLRYGVVDGSVTTDSTTARSLELADAYTHIHCTNAAGCAITVIEQATVAWVGAPVITGDQGGAGAVTFIADTDVTILCADTLVTDGLGSPWALKRLASNVWLLTGRLVA